MKIIRKFRNFIYWAAIAVTRRRPAPDRIPTSPPGSLANNFHETHLCVPGNPYQYLLVDKLSSHGVEGVFFGDLGQGGHPASVPYENLSYFEFEDRHFFHGYEIRTISALRFLCQCAIAYSKFAIWWDKTAQYLFNKRRLVRRDRIEILRLFVFKTVVNPSFSTSAFDLIRTMYSMRAFSHPQGSATMGYYGIVLDALVASGDLKKEQHSYTLMPQGLTSLATFEIEDTRFRQAIRHQFLLAVLTAALVLVGLTQAYVTYRATPQPTNQSTGTITLRSGSLYGG